MCPPAIGAAAAALSSMTASTMFAVSLGVSALSAGVGYIGQMQAAQASADAQSANLLATRNAAVDSQRRQDADLHVREGQLRTSTALTLDNQAKAKAQAAATATASSESAGLSFDGLLGDFDRQYASFADSQMQQLGWDIDQVQRTREGIAAQAQSRVNTIPRTPIQTPSLFGTVLGVAGSAFNAYDTYSVRDPFTGERTLT